jgi:tetratricopeptide (TPR) repeat protein
LIWTVALAGMVACGGEEGERVELGAPQQQERADARANWSPELTARIDDANTAYAAGDYQEAADNFRAITEEQPELGVAWFGLSMAERAMGNEEAAAEALARSEELAPGLGRMHEAATDSTMRAPGMPQGHPPMGGDSMAAPTTTGG